MQNSLKKPTSQALIKLVPSFWTLIFSLFLATILLIGLPVTAVQAEDLESSNFAVSNDALVINLTGDSNTFAISGVNDPIVGITETDGLTVEPQILGQTSASPTPTTITKKSCNQNCATDTECISGLVCYQGRCRRSDHLESASCSAVGTGTAVTVAAVTEAPVSFLRQIIETLQPAQLFDIQVEVEDTTILSIKELVARVIFENFGQETTPVDLTFLILNESLQEVYRYEGVEEDIIVETEAIYTKTFEEAPELPDGRYTLEVITLYNEDVEDSFRVNFTIGDFAARARLFYIAVGLALFLFLLILFLLVRRRRKDDEDEESGRGKGKRKKKRRPLLRLKRLKRRFFKRNKKSSLSNFKVFGLVLGLASLLIAGFFTPQAVAVINQAFSYQGKVLDRTTKQAITSSQASCVSNDSCDFRVSLYDASTGGTLLWQETKTDIAINSVDGSFELNLNCSGTFANCNQNGGPDFNTANLYIQLEFAPAGASSFTETFAPRKQLTAVPYAFNADTVDGVHVTTTTATPESSITGSVGDLALDTANGKIYLKTSGSETNTGWADMTAGNGKYVGKTSTSYQGTITNASYVSYQAVNSICAAQYTGSHVCSTDEILMTIASGNFSSYSSDGDVWIVEGPPGYTANANDCDGWTSSSENYLGPFWDWDANTGGGRGMLTPCSSTLPVACCR